MAPGNEFARYFCAGIGPLQLGVVLVILIVFLTKTMEISYFRTTIVQVGYFFSFWSISI